MWIFGIKAENARQVMKSKIMLASLRLFAISICRQMGQFVPVQSWSWLPEIKVSEKTTEMTRHNARARSMIFLFDSSFIPCIKTTNYASRLLLFFRGLGAQAKRQQIALFAVVFHTRAALRVIRALNFGAKTLFYV